MGLRNLFLHFVLFFCLVFASAFGFAVAGFFYPLAVIAVAVLLFLAARRTLNLTWPHSLISRWELLMLTALSVFLVLTFFLSSPSYFGGRDPGAIVEAGVMLAKNKQLEFKPETLAVFNNKDSNDLALNYPGFIITESGKLKTQFNVGYVSYLGFWYGLAGETGLRIANIFGLLLGLISFYYIVTHIAKNPVLGLASLPPLLLSFPFFWQTRQNYSEALAFGFLFATIYLVMEFKRQRLAPKRYAAAALLTVFCFALIRAEGILIAAITLLLLDRIARKRGLMLWTRNFVSAALALFLVFLAYSLTILPFYKKMAKDLLDYEKGNTALFSLGLLSHLKKGFQKFVYVLSVFYHYGLGLILAAGGAGLAAQLLNLRGRQRKPLINLATIPLFIAGPFLFYFANPMITMDHPWILRRFFFAAIPLLVLYGALFAFEYIPRKSLAFIFMALALVFQVTVFANYGFTRNYPELIGQIEILSQKFGKNDLVLVDKSSAPDSWTLLDAPLRFLFGKNAVYIYNPHDITRIPKGAFTNIYLISAPRQASKYFAYARADEKKDSFTLKYSHLKIAPYDKDKKESAKIILPPYVQEEKNINIYNLRPL